MYTYRIALVSNNTDIQSQVKTWIFESTGLEFFCASSENSLPEHNYDLLVIDQSGLENHLPLQDQTQLKAPQIWGLYSESQIEVALSDLKKGIVSDFLILEMMSLACFKKAWIQLTHRKSQYSLIQSESELRLIASSLDDIIYTLDSQLVCSKIYGTWSKHFPISQESVLGLSFDSFDFETKDYHLKQHQDALAGEELEYFWTMKTKRFHFIYQTTLIPLKTDLGEIIGVLGVIRDITHIKQSEDAIAQSLSEKEVLLQEVYHRVKNNLQVISSMLSLQGRKSKNEETRRILKITQNRVLSMALVHEKLYESKDLTHINFAEYIKDLSQQIAYSFGMGSHDILLGFECDLIHLDIDTAISCGLILNELISNCFKHAYKNFRENEQNRLEISFKNDSEFYTLRIKDNGEGLPETVNFYASQSLGLRLVNSLARQINAQLEVENQNGCDIKLKIPVSWGANGTDFNR